MCEDNLMNDCDVSEQIKLQKLKRLIRFKIDLRNNYDSQLNRIEKLRDEVQIQLADLSMQLKQAFEDWKNS